MENVLSSPTLEYSEWINNDDDESWVDLLLAWRTKAFSSALRNFAVSGKSTTTAIG